MKRGDFSAAWDVADTHLSRITDDEWRRPRHLQHIWRGQPLQDRRVLVRCYHGLGDSVQFVRYLPLLQGIARHVTLWIQPQLIPLVRGMPGVDVVLPLHDGAPDVDFDVDVELMELPHIFRSTLSTLPATVPYLSLPAERLRLGDGLQVGVAWRAGGWDLRRSMAVDLAHQIVDSFPIRYHVLQEWVWPHEQVLFRSPPSAPLPETAALIASLDLVITVDTLIAHLAGALGRPTWVLLHSDPDWRWMVDRDDSPWYPTARLFRQSAPGEWTPVIERVRAALASLCAAAKARSHAGEIGNELGHRFLT